MRRFLVTLAIVMAVFPLSQSYASKSATTSDELIEGAKQCTRHLPRYEREYGIPTHLLSAIASTESGRYHDGLKLKLPWPWTINAEGKGYVFDTKAQAIAAVRRLRAQGVQSIDVGCMQVNLYHHPDAFASLDQAFEPEHNIAYAASFLRNLYQEDGSWKKAAADYHSKTPKLGTEYVGLVYNSWYQIIEKLRAARLQVPDNSVVAAMASQKVKQVKPTTTAALTSRLPEQRGKKVAAHQAPHMNSIAVTTEAATTPSIQERRDSSMMVVTPAETMTMAQAQPSAGGDPVAQAKIIHVDTPAPDVKVIPVAHKTGPNFIFND